MNRSRLITTKALFLLVALAFPAFAEVGNSQPARTLRVLSYNIHHGEGVDRKLDLERIAGVILSVKPDIVAVQEVDQKTNRTNSVDQPAELARLTKMNVVFGDNIAFGGGKYGNCVLSKSPLKLHKNHALPNFENGEQRGALEVEIDLGKGAGKITLFATHFDHRAKDSERVASAKKINELVSAHPARPTVLAGDLNDVPDSRTLKELAKHWTRANQRIAPTIPVQAPTKQIDYVLHHPAKRWRVLETKVLKEAVASDHRAILAVLELQPSR